MMTREQLRERFEKIYLTNRSLREAGEDVKFTDMISSSEKARANSKWKAKDGNIKGQKEIISAAKEGDKDAINYIFLRCADNIGKTFWKSYLGPNPQERKRRIKQGAIFEWATIAYETLTTGFKGYRDAKGALETFSPGKYDTGDLLRNFGFYYWQLLRNSANEANLVEQAGGISETPGIKGGKWTEKKSGIVSYDPTYMNDDMDDDMSSQNRYGDPDKVMNDSDDKIEADRFMESWKDFAQDEIINEVRSGASPAGILRLVIETGADESGLKVLEAAYPKISRNTLKSYVNKAVEEMSEYGLGYDELMNAIKVYGKDKVASYLQKDNVTPAKVETKTESPKTSKKTKSYDAEFAEFAKDGRIWASSRKGWNVAAMIKEMLVDPTLDHTDFQEMNNIPGTWNQETYNKVFRWLNKHGINWENLKKLPLSKRKEYAKMVEK